MTLSANFEIAAGSLSASVCPRCKEMTEGSCYECYLRRAGKPTAECHHVFGPDEPLTVDGVPGNIHQAFTRRQVARQPLLKKKSHDPIVEIARVATTAAEAIAIFADRMRRAGKIEWLPKLAEIVAAACRKGADWLLVLQGWLVKNHGEDWFQDADLPAWSLR